MSLRKTFFGSQPFETPPSGPRPEDRLRPGGDAPIPTTGRNAPDKTRNIRIASAAAMIAGFFMPWASIWGVSLPGYKIPEIASGIHQFSRAMSGRGDPNFLLAYSVYAVPILALLTVLDALGGSTNERRRRSLGALTGGLPLLGFTYILGKVGMDLFQILAIGAYWTLIAGVVLLLSTLQSFPRSAADASYLSSARGEAAKGQKTCNRCGSYNKIGNRFCVECGAPLAE